MFGSGIVECADVIYYVMVYLYPIDLNLVQTATPSTSNTSIAVLVLYFT